MGLRLNPWHRFAAALASVVCLWSALAAFRDDGRIGLPFLGGAMLMLLALSRPHDGEPWFPPFSLYGERGATFVVRHWIAVAVVGVVLSALIAGEGYMQNQIAKQQQVQQRVADEQQEQWWKQQVMKSEAKYQACMTKALGDENNRIQIFSYPGMPQKFSARVSVIGLSQPEIPIWTE